MIERKFDPSVPLSYVTYGRMSSDLQNKRSPDQQFATIQETIQRNGHPWRQLGSYRDDAVSGRKNERPGFQAMLQAIEAGLIEPDLIVVDTYERFGRNEGLPEIRRRLKNNHAVLVVAADSNFADPTGINGQAMGWLEQFRATQFSQNLSHNVKRGKKDSVRQGLWPGGPIPFGFRHRPVIDDSNPTVVRKVFEVDPRQSAALKLAFERAAETGEGASRLSQWWNGSPEIPDDFKPISAFTMLYRLKSKIALGVLVWGKNHTDIIDDTRVIERNPDGPEEFPDFCTPLISVELFERVQSLLETRSANVKASRESRREKPPKKLITPLSRGMVLKYVLTGLAKCGACNASMRPVPSGVQSTHKRRYLYYQCPRHLDGACDNTQSFPEDQLRAGVITRLRALLFPPPEREGQVPDWFPQIMREIQTELDRHTEGEPHRVRAVELEIKELEQKLSGWCQSLGDPQLPNSVRDDITAEYIKVKKRKEELELSLDRQKTLESYAQRILDPKKVIEGLRHLDEILASSSPTLTNLELSRHIERIDCYPDGRVVMRGTRLGLFEGAINLLTRDNSTPSADSLTASSKFTPTVSRRRTRMRVPNLSTSSKEIQGNIDDALNPARFEGLNESFFWSEPIFIEKNPSWAKKYALEVLKKRAEGVTMESMAEHFGKTIPTIRSALKIGKSMLPDQKLPKKVFPERWFEVHANEIKKLKDQGWTTRRLADHFEKSDTTIRSALNFAKAQSRPSNQVKDDDSKA